MRKYKFGKANQMLIFEDQRSSGSWIRHWQSSSQSLPPHRLHL